MEKRIENRSAEIRAPLSAQQPANSQINWIKDLVRSEAEFLRSGSYELIGQQDSQRIMNDSTIEFQKELKVEFDRCAALFNEARGGGHLPNSVKIFHVSNTAADFIVLRNSLKLLVSNTASGIVGFNFLTRSSPYAPQQAQRRGEGIDLIAQMLPFHELVWTYHGEKINTRAVVRYFFTELVKSSAV